jgi:hypothetical protein
VLNQHISSNVVALSLRLVKICQRSCSICLDPAGISTRKSVISYYAIAVLWLKLLDIKAKQGERGLTSAEKDVRKADFPT